MTEVGICPAGGPHKLSGPIIVDPRAGYPNGGVTTPAQLQVCEECGSWCNPKWQPKPKTDKATRPTDTGEGKPPC